MITTDTGVNGVTTHRIFDDDGFLAAEVVHFTDRILFRTYAGRDAETGEHTFDTVHTINL